MRLMLIALLFCGCVWAADEAATAEAAITAEKADVAAKKAK